MQIVRSHTREFQAALARLRDRLTAQAETLSEEARERSVRLFGEALTPVQAVRRIIGDVRRMGDAAVSLYTEKFDRCTLSPEEFRVPKPQIDAARDKIAPELLQAMRQAKEAIHRFQQNLRERAPRDIVQGDRTLSARSAPLDSAGLHVPGFLAPAPSTLLMTAIPAQVAGVRRIALCTPPQREGSVHLSILAAAAECGIGEVYRVAGVQAVAALAYGTATIPRVDKIVGPGNLYVQLAKKEVFGAVDIDQFAGPSEILVIADDTAEPAWVAADLLSQAEHSPDASSILVTSDSALAARVASEVERQLELLPRKDIARQSLQSYGLTILAGSLEECLEIADEIAPEHLELHVRGAESVAARVRHAGAVFVGPYAPEAVGDYLAGPSHVLPTGGTARFFSGLSVQDFMRHWAVIYYSRQALRELQEPLARLAECEGLDAHARSAQARFRQ